MMLLLRLAPERLERLPARVWVEWAPVLATWSTAFANGAKWDDKRRLLELAGSNNATPAARSALLARVEAEVSQGKRPYAENEASYLWDDTVAATYFRLARNAPPDPRAELVTTVAKHDFDLIRPLLHQWLNDTAEGDRRTLAARLLVDHDLGQSWSTVKPAFDADPTFAQKVLGGTSIVRGFEPSDHLPAPVLVDMYLWLRSKFPPETDPQFDDAHAVGPREQIGHWRDKLLSQLRDSGTPDAVQGIRGIAGALPADRYLTRTLAIAEAALRRNLWSPTPLSQLLRLAADLESVLIHDAETLCAAVAAALGTIQIRLTGATPESHYLWDSHAGRPKSEDEVSDYLANELSQVLTSRGVVVNREVQVRRNRPSGIGERTDLLVDAAPASGGDSGRLTVPVEVKGAWNSELRTAMVDQLFDRYMRDIAAPYGVYAVAWPDLESWTDTSDSRRAAMASLDRAALEAELAGQAADLVQRGARVRVVHLEIAYLRPG